MEQTVKDWVSRDTFGYGYLLDFYQRGARVCWMDEAGLVLRDDRYRISYTGGQVPADLAELNGPGLVLTDSGALKERLSAVHPDWMVMDFSQAYYLQKEPPRVQARPGVSVRPLTLEDMDFVLENYHNPGAYESHIRQRIAEGMLGGLVDGELASPVFTRRALWACWRCCPNSAAGGWRRCWRRPSSPGSWSGGASPTAMCAAATPPPRPCKGSWG